MDTSAALNVRMILRRKDELVLERQGVKSKQVFLGSTVLVVQLENQPVVIDTFHTALPFATCGRLVVMMEHLKFDIA